MRMRRAGFFCGMCAKSAINRCDTPNEKLLKMISIVGDIEIKI